MFNDVVELFKAASAKIKIITIYNLICVVLGLFLSLLPLIITPIALGAVIPGFLLPLLLFLSLSAAVLSLNYFLLKKKKAAFYLMLVWYGIQSIQLGTLVFYYGIQFSFTFNAIGINVPALLMFVILLCAYKDIEEDEGRGRGNGSEGAETHRGTA